MNPGFHFDPVAHIYTLDGVRLPSCTQILKEIVSTAYYPEQGNHRQRGTDVHEATCVLDTFMQSGRLDLFDFEGKYAAYDGYLESYVRMMEAWPFKWQHAEYVTYDRDLLVGMTVDRIGVFKGSPCVCDLKTGKLEKEVRLQTAAGARAFFGRKKAKEEVRRFAIRLFADGKAGEPDEHVEPFDIDAWEGVSTFYKWPYRRAA